MEGFIQYFGWAVIIAVVVLAVVYLKKNGILVRRVKHGKSEVEFEVERTKEKSGDDEKDQSKSGNIDCGESFQLFRIFLGSPEGLESFRNVFCEEVDFFNKNHAEKRNITFRVTKWEDFSTEYGRPQSIINKKLATCKGYVLLLHDRWGSPPGDSDGRSFSSGSEEEFAIAEEMIKGGQMDKIGVYFRSIDPERLKSPDEQLAKVRKFYGDIKGKHVLLYNEFADKVEFRKKVHGFMADWLDDIAPWRKPEVKSVLVYEKDPD